MRRWLESLARHLWSPDRGGAWTLASALLLPFELLYRAGLGIRQQAYAAGWLARVKPPVPTISVGNLVVGGAGKTPVAGWMARLLADGGHRPAVVSRGYGSDELDLHRRWNVDVPVFADPDRARGVDRAAEEGSRCCIVDDGFQHRRLRRHLDVVLMPAEAPFRVRLLPRGPWREALGALERADRVVVTRKTADRERARSWEERIQRRFPGLPVAHLYLAVDGWTTLDGAGTEAPSGPLLAATGIARPESFADLVHRETGCEVELMAFPDHHAFTAADLAEIRSRAGDRTVVTTEKDAVRLEEEPGRAPTVRVLRLTVKEEEGAEDLRDALLRVAQRTPEEGARPSSQSGGDLPKSPGSTAVPEDPA